MNADTEAIVLWAIPDWATWVAYEQAWRRGGVRCDGWRRAVLDLGATWQRQLLVDSALSPLRIGRQPAVSDRRPLEEV